MLEYAHLHSDSFIKGRLDILHAMTDLGAYSMFKDNPTGDELGQAALHGAFAHKDPLWRWGSYGCLQQI